MKKIIYLFSLIILLFSNEIKASHYVGYDMTLISLGNDFYKLRAVAYRDVTGAGFPSSMQFNVYVNNSPWTTAAPIPRITVNQVSVSKVTYDPKDCPPAGADLLLEKYVYESASINLASLNASVGYYVTYSTCCRNPGVKNVLNSSGAGITFTMEFPRLNGGATRYNSSPEFKKAPLSFFCVGKPYTLDWNIVDPDGDSMVYYIAQSYSDGTTKPLPLIDYAPGYNLYYNNIDGVPDLSMNIKTGIINFIPTQVGRYLVAFRVEEWKRASGNTPGYKIGEIRREFQLETTLCPDSPPVTTDELNQKRVIVDTVYYNTVYNKIFTSRDSPTDSLYMMIIPNISAGENVLDPVKFGGKWGEAGSVLGNNSNLILGDLALVKGEFSWKPSCAVVRPKPYKFTVVVRDKTCPSPFYDSTFVTIYVKKKPNNKPYFVEPDTMKTPKTKNYFVLAGDRFQLAGDTLIKSYDKDSLGNVVSLFMEPDPGNGVVNSKFVFSSNPNTIHSTATFGWQTTCEDVRSTPYKVRFIAEDDDCLKHDSAYFDVNIYVRQRPNLKPVFDQVLNKKEYHIPEGQTKSFNIRVNDSASFAVNQYDSLTVTADLSEFNVPGGVMPTFTPVVSADSSVTPFTWSPNCANVSNNPYRLYLTVQDNGCPRLTKRDTILVYADGPFNSAPEFRDPLNPASIITTLDTSIYGGEVFSYNLFAVDTNQRFDSVFLQADYTSDLFAFGKVTNLAFLTPSFGKDSSRTTLNWQSDCKDISATPYVVKILARDNECVNPERSALTINLTVKEKPNYTPIFNSSTATTFFNMQAGDTLYIPLSAVDTNRLDILTLDTVYTSIPNRLPLPEITRASGSDSVRTFLKWVLDCSLISDQAYTIKIGAWDNACRLITDSARYQFTVKVNRNPNLVPYFPFATGDTVIQLVAGEKYELDLTSASATPGDSIEIATSGDVYGGIQGNLATFEQTVTTGTAKATFRWETSCDQIRDDVYTAVFKTANPPCLTDTNTYTIRFKVIPNTDITEELPNVFTPNDDGTNDVFSIKDKFKVYCDPEFSFTIFNRWGKKIFESKDPEFEWDGDGAGAGTYFYTLTSRVRTQTGSVNLVR
jgi:gliding motility-associated-like protein